MKIINWIRSRRKLSIEESRCAFLKSVFISLAFTKFISNEDRWQMIESNIVWAFKSDIIDVSESDALKAYSMLKIFKRVDADLALKSDQTVVYRLMQEVGFTYV